MATGITATSSESMVGAVLSSRYRLVRLLGEGGLAAAFEALDLTGGGRCAIKLLRPEYAAERRVLAQFYIEAEAAARLVHPNIARCFGHSPPDAPMPYVVMEFVEGASVASYLRPGLAYETQYALPIAQGLLAALTEAHRLGFVHGNIKPSNVILVPRPDGPPVVKLLDFGTGKVMDAAGGIMTRTRNGSFLGSPSYLSPEQIRNAREIGPRTDLWSAAIILYQLLTGRDPFPAPTEAAKLTLVLSTDPHPVDQGKPALSAWRGFFARALARQAEHRFASGPEMEAAMIEAAGAPARGALGSSVTDMSPQLAEVVARSGAQARIEVLRAPLRISPSEGAPRTESTLRAGQIAVMTPRGQRVPLWLAVSVAVLCLAIGFVAGFFVAQL
jgi:eukaryotic-like serine/threonine-protein kinase